MMGFKAKATWLREEAPHFQQSVLAECQRPKPQGFPSRPKKPSGGSPGIIQEAELQTAHWWDFPPFPPPQDLCLQPQLFKIAVSHAWNGTALAPGSGGSCQACLLEGPAHPSGSGLHPEFFLSLFVSEALRRTRCQRTRVGGP